MPSDSILVLACSDVWVHRYAARELECTEEDICELVDKWGPGIIAGSVLGMLRAVRDHVEAQAETCVWTRYPHADATDIGTLAFRAGCCDEWYQDCDMDGWKGCPFCTRPVERKEAENG